MPWNEVVEPSGSRMMVLFQTVGKKYHYKSFIMNNFPTQRKENPAELARTVISKVLLRLCVQICVWTCVCVFPGGNFGYPAALLKSCKY